MPGPLTLGQIVARLGGRVAGNAETVVHQVASLEGATAEHISFFTGRRYRAKLAATRAGAVIGADGVGIADEDGRWVKMPQIGAVRIGDDVEIGANTTIDRGAIDDTVIEDGVKLDNQIQVGHNVRIGAHTAIAGCAGIAGSADIGRHCTIGGAAIIIGHLRIADHVNISAGTLISRSILKPGTYTGVYPFDEHASWARAAAGLRRKGKKNG